MKIINDRSSKIIIQSRYSLTELTKHADEYPIFRPEDEDSYDLDLPRTKLIGYQYELVCNELKYNDIGIYLKTINNHNLYLLYKKNKVNIYIFEEFQMLPFYNKIFKGYNKIKWPASTKMFSEWFGEIMDKRMEHFKLEEEFEPKTELEN